MARTSLLLLGFLLVSLPVWSGPAETTGLIAHLPRNGETPGWKAEGAPQSFSGEDLYLLIDGGAELFHEYGFVQVATQSYQDPERHTLSLEIYQMRDAEAAFGIYSLRTGKSGRLLPVGSECRLEDYYLNFWQGEFLVTVTGLDTSPQTLAGLEILARAAASTLPGKNPRPALTASLPQEGLDQAGVKFIRGNLALNNLYSFDTRDIFGLDRAVMGQYPGASLFIIAYPDAAALNKKMAAISGSLQNNKRFHGFAEKEGRLSFLDSQNRIILAAPCGSNLAIAISRTDPGSLPDLETLLSQTCSDKPAK